MFERAEPILKTICGVLAALLLVQWSLIAARKSPLDPVNIPAALLISTSTNSIPQPSGTNSGPARETAPKPPETPASGRIGVPPRGMMPMPGMPSGVPGPALPPPIQARVDKITQSEILGSVVRPMPMALLGIAGRHAVLRAPNGQTGLVREGEELGGVKLLRLGTNRILIEHEGQNKELTIFSGFGGETLMSKGKETSK